MLPKVTKVTTVRFGGFDNYIVSIKRELTIPRFSPLNMELLLVVFPLLAGALFLGALSLIRAFILSQPVGNRTVSFFTLQSYRVLF